MRASYHPRVKPGLYAAVTTLLLLFAVPRNLGACECVGVSSFQKVATGAEIVFTGRVVATHLSIPWGEDRPDYVDVEVESVARGEVTGVIRVWDVLATTSCGGGLRSLGVGMRVEFAVGGPGSWKPWDATPGIPAPHPTVGYFCGKPWRYALTSKRP